MHVSTTRYMCQATCVATHIHVFRIEPEGMSCVASSTAYVFYGTATPPVVAAAPAFCSCCPLPVGITFVPRNDSHDADALTTHTHFDWVFRYRLCKRIANLPAQLVFLSVNTLLVDLRFTRGECRSSEFQSWWAGAKLNKRRKKCSQISTKSCSSEHVMLKFGS